MAHEFKNLRIFKTLELPCTHLIIEFSFIGSLINDVSVKYVLSPAEKSIPLLECNPQNIYDYEDLLDCVRSCSCEIICPKVDYFTVTLRFIAKVIKESRDRLQMQMF